MNVRFKSVIVVQSALPKLRNISIKLAIILALGASFTLLSCVSDGSENTSTHTGPFPIHHIGGRH